MVHRWRLIYFIITILVCSIENNQEAVGGKLSNYTLNIFMLLNVKLLTREVFNNIFYAVLSMKTSFGWELDENTVMWPKL